MGCLDPKIDKERVFTLLRQKSATKAVVEYSGGNDEGGVNSIILTIQLANGELEERDFLVWYCGGYQYLGGGGYKRLNEWENEDQELSELLQGPVDEKYGSWAGDFSAYGELIWDVEGGTVVLEDNVQSEYEHSTEEW